jgi:hypothetical protein
MAEFLGRARSSLCHRSFTIAPRNPCINGGRK